MRTAAVAGLWLAWSLAAVDPTSSSRPKPPSTVETRQPESKSKSKPPSMMQASSCFEAYSACLAEDGDGVLAQAVVDKATAEAFCGARRDGRLAGCLRARRWSLEDCQGATADEEDELRLADRIARLCPTLTADDADDACVFRVLQRCVYHPVMKEGESCDVSCDERTMEVQSSTLGNLQPEDDGSRLIRSDDKENGPSLAEKEDDNDDSGGGRSRLCFALLPAALILLHLA